LFTWLNNKIDSFGGLLIIVEKPIWRNKIGCLHD
jgi:hypothetical protein